MAEALEEVVSWSIARRHAGVICITSTPTATRSAIFNKPCNVVTWVLVVAAGEEQLPLDNLNPDGTRRRMGEPGTLGRRRMGSSTTPVMVMVTGAARHLLSSREPVGVVSEDALRAVGVARADAL